MTPNMQNMGFQREMMFWCLSLKRCESCFVRLSSVLITYIYIHISVHKGQLATIYRVVRLRQGNLLAQVTSVSVCFEEFIRGKQIILWPYCQRRKMLQSTAIWSDKASCPHAAPPINLPARRRAAAGLWIRTNLVRAGSDGSQTALILSVSRMRHKLALWQRFSQRRKMHHSRLMGSDSLVLAVAVKSAAMPCYNVSVWPKVAH